ncbi:MAG: DUF362 domain-containing protein [Deltaproteobacteria bacterium]|nr:DUF362 domain-containing protein [Deltaproteobacteria bacterium]
MTDSTVTGPLPSPGDATRTAERRRSSEDAAAPRRASRRGFLKKTCLWFVSLIAPWSSADCRDSPGADDGPVSDAARTGNGGDGAAVDDGGEDDAGLPAPDGAPVEPGAEPAEDGGADAGNPAAGPLVVRVSSPVVSNWDFSAANYWGLVDGIAYRRMFDAGLTAVAGTGTTDEAWRKLLTGWRPGDIIAIKPNLNNGLSASTNLNPLPLTFAMLVDSLKRFGANESDIVVYEAAGSRGFIDYLASAIKAAFPGVRLLNPPGGGNAALGIGETSFGTGDPDETVAYSRSGHPASTVAACLVNAAHLINVPILRSHFGGGETLITGALKNHYGSVDIRHHDFQDEDWNPIAEVNLNPNIRGKTRLVMMEGIFGRFSGGPWGEPQRWKTFPAGTPQSLIFSTDPVAVDSVGIDLILAELDAQGISPVQHAAQHNADALGIGVHDHARPDGTYSRLSHVKIVV